MAYEIFDIANAFLAKEEMTHKKLQKLCYYAQCWNLYFNDKEKLADTDFQAWVHGPASIELYQHYKTYGYNNIPKYTGLLRLEKKHQEVIDAVFKAYGEFDANSLEAFTHSEKPWINARGDKKPYEASDVVISEEDMYQFCVATMNENQPDV